MNKTNNIETVDNSQHYSTSSIKLLRITAKIALGISILATLVLATALFLLLKNQPEDNYLAFIQSLTRSQEQLASAMLISASLIIIIAGLITWFIVLYSSARVTGPLYRFSKNIELEIDHGPVATIKLREDDYFQGLSDKLARAADNLNQHYGKQLQQIDSLYCDLQSTEKINAEQYHQHLQKLKNSACSK